MAKATVAEPALFADGELADAPDVTVQGAYDAYNETAAALPWRKATVLTKARRATLKRAVQDYGGISGFKAALERAAKSPFLLGHRGRTGAFKNWKPSLDFLCQPKSIVNLLEGVYDGDIEEVGPKRLHIPTAYQPPHLKPAEPFVPEPREVRLAGMVATYRKNGKWADANRIEQELANLEGRPAVLVPAPSVANVGMPGSTQTEPLPDNQKVTRKPSDINRRAPTITDIEPPDWDDEVPMGAEHEADD